MKIKKITKKKEPRVTVDIQVSGNHTYQLSNGMISHNTVSSLVNSSSGIHARYAKYYIRRVRSNKDDPIVELMINAGFPYEQDTMNPKALIFSFPMKSPKDCVLAKDMTVIQQLEIWKTYTENWCEHAVSCTIYVREHEWIECGAWVYKNFDKVSGLSFLPFNDDDHIYEQAPYERIDKETYEAMLEKMPKDVDWSKIVDFEEEDNTTSSHELACTGGSCDLI